jgi:hypothetical protein
MAVCSEIAYYEFDNGVSWRLDRIKETVETVDIGGVIFFKVDPYSKQLIAAIGDTCNCLEQVSGRRFHFSKSAALRQVTDLRNAESFKARDASNVPDPFKVGNMRKRDYLQIRPRTQQQAEREEPEIIEIMLPALGDDPPLKTFAVKAVHKKDRLALQLNAETLNRFVALVRSGGIEAKGIRESQKHLPKGVLKNCSQTSLKSFLSVLPTGQGTPVKTKACDD